MELGLHVCDFTWASGGTQLGPTLTRVARTAEQAGFTRLTVMDHLWQIGGLGPPEHEMLEAYTTLGYLAAVTSTVQLHALAATRACWQRSSARSTCCREGAPGWVSARPGTATRRPGWG